MQIKPNTKQLRVKSIELEMREWSDGTFGPMVTFMRWGDVNTKLTQKNTRQSHFYSPTRPSIFRCLQAMEAMSKRQAAAGQAGEAELDKSTKPINHNEQAHKDMLDHYNKLTDNGNLELPW